jgi:hypothetical protein
MTLVTRKRSKEARRLRWRACLDPKRRPTDLLRRSFPAEQFYLNLVCEESKVTGKSVKQLALGRVCCNVANQPTFGCVRSEFFQASLKVLHGSTGRELAALLVTVGQNYRAWESREQVA